ncbi:MAG: sugar phosphate isomerase/epimerase family protein [Armatimonadota bacterium]|nr:sugar phosphate isomerase/epimerase family protein [Armatimonadota bacterium]
MKIGIRNGSMGFPGMADLFPQVAEIGFDGVELDIRADYENEAVLSARERAEIKRLSEETGVEVPSLCVGALWRYSPAASDDTLLDTARHLLTASIQAAADLGAEWILVPVTPAEEEISHAECTARWIREMAAIGPVAQEAGVILCLENVGRGCGKSAEELRTLAEGADSSAVATYYDIGNATAFGNDPVAEIRDLGDLIGVVHVKDREADLLGEGIVDIPACLEALREIGYDGWLILETPPTDDAMRAGRHNLQYLRDLVS